MRAKITRLAELSELDPVAAANYAAAAAAIAKQCGAILHGNDMRVQGGALADLVAMYISGHQPENADDAEQWAEVMSAREIVLNAFIEAVRSLVPVNDQMLAERYHRSPTPRRQ